MREYKPIKMFETPMGVSKLMCDCCGGTIFETEEPTQYQHGEWFTIDHVFGYDSTIFGDMARLKVDICEQCLADWVGKFKNQKIDTDFNQTQTLQEIADARKEYEMTIQDSDIVKDD